MHKNSDWRVTSGEVSVKTEECWWCPFFLELSVVGVLDCHVKRVLNKIKESLDRSAHDLIPLTSCSCIAITIVISLA